VIFVLLSQLQPSFALPALVLLKLINS
jgi:hypothetical protein